MSVHPQWFPPSSSINKTSPSLWFQNLCHHHYEGVQPARCMVTNIFPMPVDMPTTILADAEPQADADVEAESALCLMSSGAGWRWSRRAWVQGMQRSSECRCRSSSSNLGPPLSRRTCAIRRSRHSQRRGVRCPSSVPPPQRLWQRYSLRRGKRQSRQVKSRMAPPVWTRRSPITQSTLVLQWCWISLRTCFSPQSARGCVAGGTEAHQPDS